MLHYSIELCTSLSEICSPHLIVPIDTEIPAYLPDIPVTEFRIPTDYSDFGPSNIKTALNMKKYFYNNGINIIHGISNHPFLVLISLISNKPFHYTCHDVVQHVGEFSWVKELSQSLLIKTSDEVYVHGKFNQSEFIEKYRTNPITIIHGPYNMFREFCSSSDFDTNVLFFGRIKEYKGLDLLLDAFDKRTMDFELTIAGNGELNICQREGVDTINRYIENDEVCELFTGTDLVVLPYREASQSGVLQLAYAFDTPVVATPVGGLDEMIDQDETGKVISQVDSELLISSIQELLSSPNITDKMASNINSRKNDKWGWIKTATITLERYKMSADAIDYED